MIILICSLIFCFGIGVGYIIRWQTTRKYEDYSGTIRIHKNEEKTVFTLELDDDPKDLEFKKLVLFKVESSDRK